MPPKSARGNAVPTNAPASDLTLLWSETDTVKIDPSVPLPFEPYDEEKQIKAPRARELRDLLEEDERLSAMYTGELARLQSELRQKNKDTTDMVKYLEAEVRRKDLMSKRMNKQLADLRATHEADLSMMKKQFENTCKYMEKIFLEKERLLLEKNETLAKQIAELSEFQTLRTALAEELEATKAVILSNERRHKLQLDELEKKFLAARDGLQKEAAARILNSRQTYKLEVGRELENESSAVRFENQTLHEKLRIHEGTSDRLQALQTSYMKKIASYKQDLELRAEQNQEYLRKHLSQTKKIESITTQTKAMEEELLTSMRTREHEARKREESQINTLAPLQSRLEQLRDAAFKLDKEHKLLRREAKQTLSEKQETEQYFLKALEETRENIKRKKLLQEKEKNLLKQAQLRELTLPPALRTKLPFTSTSDYSSGSGYPSNSNNATLEIGDLTLEDREKMLRLLYAKISHVPSGLTVTLPPHSFAITVAEGEMADDRKQPFIPILSLPSQGATRKSLPPSQEGKRPLSALTASAGGSSAAQLRASAERESAAAAAAAASNALPQLLPSEGEMASSRSSASHRPVVAAPAEYDLTFLTNIKPDEDAEEDEGATDENNQEAGGWKVEQHEQMD